MKRVLEGLQILIKYEPDGSFSTGHEEIFCGGPRPEILPDDEALRLNELGWRWSGEFECWTKST